MSEAPQRKSTSDIRQGINVAAFFLCIVVALVGCALFKVLFKAAVIAYR